MLSNLTNFYNLIVGKFMKKTLDPTDLIAVGTKDGRYDGGYKPTGIKFEDLQAQLAVKNVLETTLFAFPFNYVVVPVMQKTNDVLTGPSFFFGNTATLNAYVVSGTVAVQTNSNFWYIGTVSADVPLYGTLPWKVTGTVYAFDDSLPGGGGWLQTGLSDSARFSDTNGGTVQADYCTIIEDYNSTPGSIDLYLAVNSSSAVGDIYGNVSFQYEFFIDESINVTFTN
jgi:hypothetical protein